MGGNSFYFSLDFLKDIFNLSRWAGLGIMLKPSWHHRHLIHARYIRALGNRGSKNDWAWPEPLDFSIISISDTHHRVGELEITCTGVCFRLSLKHTTPGPLMKSCTSDASTLLILQSSCQVSSVMPERNNLQTRLMLHKGFEQDPLVVKKKKVPFYSFTAEYTG